MTLPNRTHRQPSASLAEHILPQTRRNREPSHREPVSRRGWPLYALQLALLTAVYFGSAKLGLTMALVAEQVSAVWPPTGIALAALLFFGYRVWPAITLGAFLVNATANAPLAAAMGIALGNTLEALLAAWMLRRLIGFDPALGRVKDVVGLVVLAAGLSTMVSAAIGVASLCLGRVMPWSAYGDMWTVWWLGDAMGDLVAAPLLLTWAVWRGTGWRPRHLVEFAILLPGLTAISVVVFVGPFASLYHPPRAYAVFPFVIWAAIRLGQAPTTLATAVASVVAIVGTLHGYGPFLAPTINESLIMLQFFMGVVAITGLVLAAATTERKRAEESRQQSYYLLRAVVTGTTDAVYVKDRQGRYLMINDAGAAFIGKSVAEVIGENDLNLFSPESARAIMEADRRVMASGEAQTFEDVDTAAGIRRTFLSTKDPYRDAQGTILGVIGISRDITERTRSERQLATAYAITNVLAQSVSLAEDAAKVLRTIGETLHCDLGVLWQVDATANCLRCAAVWDANGAEDTDFKRFNAQIVLTRGEGLPGRAWTTGKPTWVSDASFPRSVAVRRKGPCGALAVPVQTEGNVLYVLELFSPDFHQPDVEVVPMLCNIASQIAQFIQRRQAEMMVHARQREFSLARTIQQGLLPKAPPTLPGLAIAGATLPTQETGGDYYDFIPMPDGNWGIVVGDASGHGIGAALLISATRAYLRALALTQNDPAGVLRLVNNRLVEDITTDHFVTLFFARLCPVTRSLAYSNAGHWPGYVLDAKGEVKFVLTSTNLPLGLAPAGDYSDGTAITLDRGDLVFLFTDGIVEATSESGVHFGVGGALEVIRAHRHLQPAEIMAALLHQVGEWSQNIQADDMTAIVIKVKG